MVPNGLKVGALTPLGHLPVQIHGPLFRHVVVGGGVDVEIQCCIIEFQQGYFIRVCRKEFLQCGQSELEGRWLPPHSSAMSNKQIVQDLLERVPDSASLHDIAREIEFVAAVRQGIDELDRGEGVPIEEVERELPSWIIK